MFEVSKEILDSHEALLTVEIEEPSVQEAMKKAARTISRQVNIPGFRQGKAPYNKVVRYVGEEHVRQEAVDSLIQDLYSQILEKAEVEPYSSGELDNLQIDPLVLKIRVPLEPAVELGAYQSLRHDWQDAAVNEDEVAEILEQIREEHAILEAVERPAQMGDEVHIDVVGTTTEDDEIIVDEKDIEVVLNADTPFLAPGFIDALVGMSVEEEKSVTLTLPDTIENESLQGAEATFDVKVAQVYERQIPELDDALASTVGSFETLDELKDDIHARLLAHKEQTALGSYQNAMLDALVELTTIHYPPVMLDEVLDDIVEETRENLNQRHQISLEDALRLEGQTMEEFRDQMRPQAELRLHRTLAMREFARQESIEVSDDELVQSYNQLLVSAGLGDSDMMGNLQLDSEMGHRLRNSVTMEKLMNRLVQIGRGEADAANADAADADAADADAADADAADADAADADVADDDSSEENTDE